MSSLSDTILTCSGCISICPWPCSADGGGAKSIDRGAFIAAASIGAMDTCIGSTYAIGTWTRYTGVGGTCTGGICARSTFVGGVEPRALAGLGVTLAGPRVNDCCLWLFMGLIFALTKGMYC